MIRPALQGEAFLAAVAEHRDDTESESFRVWWLGQSGYLLQWRGRHLLLDPYLSDSLTRKYAATDKPHVRMTEIVIEPWKLDFIDVVTSSHNHTDHLDAETLLPMTRANPGLELIAPEANRRFITARLGCRREFPTGLDSGQSVEIAGFRVHAVPAAHEALDCDDEGRHIYLGYVVEFGPWRIYHSGDTVRYRGMAQIVGGRKIDLAMLPINGSKPERRVAGNLDGPGAAELARDIHARVVTPCHYDMFEFNTESPDAFIAACEKLGQPYRVLEAGETWSSTELD